MDKNAIVEALKALKAPGLGWVGRELVDVEHSPTVVYYDGRIVVSAEDGKGFCDFYGEYRGGYPWIHPVLENFAKEHNCHWEWDDPGSITLWEGR